MGVAMMVGTVAPVLAYDVPLAGSPYYLQTSGPTAGIGIGDWYSDTAGGGGAGYHYYGLDIPCTWPAGTPIHVDIFSPELHTAGTVLDEIRGGAGNTTFEIYAAGTVVAPFVTPAPLAAGSLLQTVYTPVATADNYVRFYTIAAPVTCGLYILRTQTQGDDDNGWRLRVGSDNDADPNNAPPPASDPGIAISQIYGTFQHSGPNPSCISLYEYIASAGTTTFHNFDIDGNTSVTYYPPNGAPVTGTVSGNAVWNNGGTASTRVGDTVAVAANQIGYWRVETCASNNNQFIQEGATPLGAYFSLPLGSTVTKDDGVTTAQHGGYLQYTITFTNNSVPTGAVAANVVIRDTIPSNTTFVNALVSAPFTGSCVFAAPVATCTVNENVIAGASGSVVVTVLVNDPAAGTTVVNTATLDYTDTSTPTPFAYPQESASDTDQLPALKLVKTSSNPGDTGDGPQVGDTITYTLTISNPSAVAQTSVVVNDPVPAGTTYVAQSTSATGFPVTPASSKTFLDQFNATSYAGTNGATLWIPLWTEINEADGPGAGDEVVTGGYLRVRDNDGGGEGVYRLADLAIAGGSGCTATLSFDRRRVGLDNANDFVTVAISGSGAGGPFTTLDTFAGPGNDGAFVSESYNLAASDVTATTVVRFLGSPNLGNNDEVRFDNVQLQNSCPASTGAKDNIPGGANPDLLSGVPATLVQAGDGLSLAPGASSTVTFSVTVNVAGPILNIATAVSAQDPDPAEGYVRDVALTRASLAGLRIGSGTVEFATSWQRGTAGFNLYAAQSRRRSAEKSRLNGALIRSPRPDSMTPILYRAEVDTAAPFFWIEEVELGSESGRLLGPFAVTDENLRRRFDRIERRLSTQPTEDRGESRSLRSERTPRVRSRSGPVRGLARNTAAGVKVEIAQAGTIQLSWAELVGGGLPPRFSRDPGRLQVTTRGQRVPFTADPGGLSFVAQDLSTDHTRTNVYVITWNGAPVMRAPVNPPDPVPPGYHRVERDRYYHQAAPRQADPWVWDFLAAGSTWPGSWDPGQGDFDLPGYFPQGGSVPVRIAFLGLTENPHHLEASINGVFVGSLDFDGRGMAVLTGSIDATLLKPSANQLTVTYFLAEGALGGYSYLSHLDLGLTLPPSAGGVLRISPYDPTLPRLPRADYLIVTHPDFAVQAEKIAALKSVGGRFAVVVDVERAYDRFTAGIPDASAVQALIARARRASTVLLVGDDTIDPADTYGLGERAFVPSAIGYDIYTGRVASENLYADRDQDGVPDLSIGRLPVHNVAEAEAMVQKIESQESLLSPNAGRHIIAVDNQGPNDFPFRSAGWGIGAMLDGALAFADVSLGASEARDTLLAGLREGALTTTYLGHGAPTFWADEAIFGSDDAASFAESGQGTVLLTWSCLSSDYRYPDGPAVSEAMVLAPMGGAVASFGPNGLSLPTLQHEFYLLLYPRLLSGETLGEAVRGAKTEFLAARPGEREFLNGWVLLGDPDVRLPQHPQARTSTSPSRW